MATTLHTAVVPGSGVLHVMWVRKAMFLQRLLKLSPFVISCHFTQYGHVVCPAMDTVIISRAHRNHCKGALVIQFSSIGSETSKFEA